MVPIAENRLRQSIIDAYFSYFTAYADRDWSRMVARFDPDITIFGTGIDEVALSGDSTRAVFEREFKQAPAKMSYRIKELEVYALAPQMALIVIVMDMDYRVGDDWVRSENNRTSAILEQKEGEWSIVHAHWSQPDVFQEPGKSLPFKLLMEENLRLEALVAKRTEELQQSNAELNEALAKVKTLKGILPICAHCKNNRNDKGYWTQLEQYICENTDAFFSHSICPDCLEKHYPGMVLENKEPSDASTGAE